MSKIGDQIDGLSSNLSTNTRVRDGLVTVRPFVEAIEASAPEKFDKIRDVHPRVFADIIRLWEYWGANGDTLPLK